MDRRPPHPGRASAPPDGHAAGDAEEVLVANYRRLARIAYLILPAGADRHHRLLAAHAVTQRALPGLSLRAGRAGHPDDLYDGLRLRVVRRALAGRVRPRGPLPGVWGLRMFTADGAEDELALDRELAELPAAARAAYALRAVDGLPPAEITDLLLRAGVARPDEARRAAGAIRTVVGEPVRFDPCTVRVQPGDLIRRRRTTRLGAAALVLAATLVGAAAAGGTAQAPAGALRLPSADGAPLAATADPAALLRAAPTEWTRTARLDFSAWPARGDRTGDSALLGRVLALWQRGGLAVHTEPGTPVGPPVGTPRLLWAGDVDGTAVVVLHDGARIAHWSAETGMVVARADDSDVTTGAAVVLRRTTRSVRFLLAPWVDTAELRRLRQPDTPATAVARTDGVTAALSTADADCRSGPVLQLRSSRTVAEKHAFLLADLGGILPAHLTWTPPPSAGAARAPREATGTDALVTWARTACNLPEQGPGVKELNAWAFAEQQLPQHAGTATWVCLRTDRWNGEGSAATELLLPGPGGGGRTVRTALAQGRGCSRFDQNTVGWTRWRAPDGHAFLLAAGSRRVARLRVRGDGPPLDAAPADRTVAVESPEGGRPEVTGVLDDGTEIHPLS
ncbi:hypothetical protein [Kitasatospora paranensis]|uniref:hypothetical protein n=1 Tax=Kitasatospora paranensis TaxID=258053 RepID=UPI003623660B